MFPAFVALVVALAFFGGFRYVFEQVQIHVRPWFLVALLVLGIAAIVARSQPTTPEGRPAVVAD